MSISQDSQEPQDDLAAQRQRRALRQAMTGDAAAFEVLVKEHYNRVFRFLMKWVRHPDHAEDLAQETFLAAWQKLPAFRQDSQFTTWLLGIALNLARNHRNRGPSRREVELPEESHLELLMDSAPAAEEDAANRGAVAALDRALARLPEDMREVIVMVRLEGLSMEEAAAALGVAVGTVKSRLFRARERLAEELQAHLD